MTIEATRLEVEHMKGQLDSMAEGQSEIKKELKGINKLLSHVVALQEANALIQAEVSKLRTKSHTHAQTLQIQELKLAHIEKELEIITTRVKDTENSEAKLKVDTAKNTMVASGVLMLIFSLALYYIKG